MNEYGNNVLNEVSQVMTRLNYGGEWRAGNWKEEEVVEISGSSVWRASTTRMLISCYKENPILWDKRLKENGNKTKAKKAMAPLTARSEKANPPRSAQDLKAK